MVEGAFWCYTGGDSLSFCVGREAFDADDGSPAGASGLNSKTAEGSSPNLEIWYPRPKPAPSCVASYEARVCPTKKTLRRVMKGCNKLSCRVCQDFLRTRRRETMRGRFLRGLEGRKKKRVLYTVFTVPLDLRLKAADPKLWTEWRRAVWKVLKKRFGGLFAAEHTDPASTCKEAKDTPELACTCRKCSKWHPHFNFLWVRREGMNADLIDLDELKAAWAKIIGAEPTRDVFGVEKPPVVVVHHRYCDPTAKDDYDAGILGKAYFHHVCSYMGRPWADWQQSVKKHLTFRWLGSYPKNEPEEPLDSIEAAERADSRKKCRCCGEYELVLKCCGIFHLETWMRRGVEAIIEEVKRRRKEVSEQRNVGPPPYPKGRVRT